MIIALRATDLAGIERCRQRVVGLLDDDETDADAVILQFEAMEVAVADRGDRDADRAILQGYRGQASSRAVDCRA